MTLLVLALLGGSGCTHVALERTTIQQSSTTSDVQYRQVLDNLAMFACNQDALAWHMKLSSASMQVTDQGTGSLAASIAHFTGFPSLVFPTWNPTVTAQRGILNQWGGIPTVDPPNLEFLNLAYQKALDPLDAGGTIKKGLYQKIREVCLRYDIVLSEKALDEVIDNSDLSDAEKWKLKQKNATLHSKYEKVFEELAALSLPPAEAQVDNYAMKLYAKVTEETRGEAREKLRVQQQQQKAQVAQTRVGVEDQIVKLTRDAGEDLSCLTRYPVNGASLHNPHDIAQAELQVKVLRELATSPKYNMPWVCVARCRREIPHGVCYVGHWGKCHCEFHVWVPPESLGTLRDFTIAVLALSPISSEETPQSIQAGTVTYSPTVAGGVH